MLDVAVPLAFFMLLLVFALVILMLKTGDMRSERPELDEDLAQQRANIMLISLLRADAPIGYEETGKKAPLADIIILNHDGTYDAAILSALESQVPSTAFFLLELKYPSRSLTLTNGRLANDVYDGVTNAYLPTAGGIITVTMHYADIHTLEEKGYERALPAREFTIVVEGDAKPTTSAEELKAIETQNAQRMGRAR